MTVVAATKYVDADAMAALAEAGVSVVGENRAQDLATKYAAHGSVFPLALHRASPEQEGADGQRPVRALPLARLAVRRAATRIPALVQVNLAGEESKSGVAVGGSMRFLPSVPSKSSGCRRCHRWPTIRRRRDRSFVDCGELAEARGLAQLSMGTTQDYRVAVDEGATLVRVGAALFQG